MKNRFPVLFLSLALLTTPAFAADTTEISIMAEGKPALKLDIPKDAQVTTKENKTSIETKDLHLRIYLWLIPGAKTVDEVVAKAGPTIKSEFVEYKVTGTDTIKMAGHEAKHLKGTGEEADDNDPGTADVVVFTDGKNIYAACVHGEKDEAAKERPAFLKVLASAKAP